MKRVKLSLLLLFNLLSIGLFAQSLTFSTTSLSFEATTGGSDQQKLTVTNGSESIINITQLSFSGTDAAMFGESNNIPIQIMPGIPMDVAIYFAPTSAGNKLATLSITTDEAGIDPYEISLTGAGGVPVQPKLVLSHPDTLKVGTVNLGAQGLRDITLTNEGNTELEITSITAGNGAIPGMESNQFTLESAHTFPVTLSVGGSLTATVGFTTSSPAFSGEALGDFVVESNDPLGTHLVTLSAWETEPLIDVVSAFDFNGVPFAKDTVAYIEVSNNATGQTAGDLVINNIDFSGADASVFSTSAGFPITISPGASDMIPVTFSPGAYGDYEATMNITGNNSAAVTLGGSGTRKYLEMATAHDFGDVQYGVGADYYSLVINATGGEPVTITDLNLGGAQADAFIFHELPATPFQISGSRTLLIRVKTNASFGEKSATLTVTSDAANGPHEVNFTASVKGPVLTSSTESLFVNGTLEEGSTLDSALTISNAGNIALDISSIGFTGYEADNFFELLSPPALPLSLAPGEDQVLNIRFKANSVSTAYGNLVIQSNDVNSPKEIALQVTPIAPMIATPQSHFNFGGINISEDTLFTVIPVENTGTENLVISSLGFQQTGDEFFSSETLPITIEPGVTRNVEVGFYPETRGIKKITVVIGSNAANDPGYVVELWGTGTQPILEVQNELDLGTAPTRSLSDPMELVLKNTGDGPLRIDTVYVAADGIESQFTIAPYEKPLIIDPNESTTLAVSFSPLDEAVYMGSLHIVSNALNGNETVSLSGSGFHAPLMEVSLSDIHFPGGNVGDTVVHELLVRNAGTSALSIFNLHFSEASSNAFISGAESTITLEENEETTLLLKYVPREKGSHSGVFSFETNDPRALNIDLNLEGAATKGEPSYSTNSLNFDITSTGSYDTLAVQVQNVGDGDLRMIYDEINPSDIFQVVYYGHRLPEDGSTIVRIAPGEIQEVLVLFHPGVVNTFSSTVTLKQAAYDNTPINFEINVSGESRTPPELQVGGLTFTADEIIEDGDLRYLHGNVHAGKLRFGGAVTVNVATNAVWGEGSVFVTGIPKIGEYGGEEVVLHDGNFEFKSGDLDDPQLYVESAFAGTDAAFTLIGMPLQVTQFELLDDGVRVGGKLWLPDEFGVNAGLSIDSLEITESNGVQLSGSAYIRDLRIMETFQLKDAYVDFNTFENRFEGRGVVGLKLLETKVNIGAGVVIKKGGLDEVRLSVEVKPGIPLGATGWNLAGGNGFIKGIQVPPLALGLGVDLVPAVPSGVEVIRLNDLTVSYTFGSTLSAEGSVQIFGQTTGGAKILVSSKKMGLSAFINLLEVFSGKVSVAMLYENNKYSVEAAAKLAVTIPKLECFMCGAINNSLPYKVASVSSYFKDNRLSANVKIWILDIGIALIFEEGNTKVEIGFDALNLNGARIARLARSRNMSISQEYNSDEMERDKLEGQSIIFNARRSDMRVVGGQSTGEVSFPFVIDQTYKTLMIRVEGPENVPDYTVVLPTGQEITAENAEELGYFHSVYEEGNMRYYAFNNVLTGNYELIIQGEGDYEIDFVGTGFRPGLSIENIDYLPDADQLKIDWNDSDADSDAKISLYYDNNGEGGDGIPIVRDLSENDAANSYTWNNDTLQNGEYYIYGVIDDGTSTPVVAYAASSFVVNKPSETPAPTLSEPTLSADTIHLSWTPVAGAESYLLFKDDDTLSYASENIGVGSNTTFGFAELSHGRTYHFAVMAVLENANRTALSNVVSVNYVSDSENNAPILSMKDVPEKAQVGKVYQAVLGMEDKDADDGLTLSFQVSPEGMSLSQEGAINWTPAGEQVGQHEVKVVLSDQAGAKDSVQFVVSVFDEKSAKGIIGFDAFRYYGDQNTAHVTLSDSDLNVDADRQEQATVRVYSTFDTDGKELTLSESGINTGVFTGQITFSADEIGQDVIAVNQADTVYIAYQDQNPNLTITDFLLYEAAITLNQFPTALGLNNLTIPEDSKPGNLIGLFNTADPDDEDSHTYTLVPGVGDEDNAFFAIEGGVLKLNDKFLDNLKHTYNIRVRTTDPKNGFYEQAFTLRYAGVLAVEDDLNDNINIYPNPTNGRVKVVVGSPEEGIAKIKVVSTDGVVRMEKRLRQDQTALDLTALPGGVYFISVEQNGEVVVRKIVKN